MIKNKELTLENIKALEKAMPSIEFKNLKKQLDKKKSKDIESIFMKQKNNNKKKSSK